MKKLLHPAALMAIIWAATALLFYASPISYVHAPGFVAWSIVCAGALLFCLGAVAGASLRWPAAARLDTPSPDRLIIVCAAMGFIGIAAMLIDKLLLSDIDWSAGFSAARDRRVVEVMANIPVRRSWLLYAGYLTFSFSCVALTAFILAGDRLRSFASLCGQASVLPMVAYAVLYGGRMPILLVIILVASAGLARLLVSRSFFPRGQWLWWKLAAVAAAMLAYTNFIWESRRQLNGIANYGDFVAVAASRWELSPAPWLDRAVLDGRIAATRLMDWLSIDLYLTHAVTTVQRMVEHWGEFSIYGGLYQIGILSPLSDALAPSLQLAARMRAELSAAGTFGWFPTAWGAWIGDAGPAGGAICILIWGMLSGMAYRAARENGSLLSQLMLAFGYMCVFVSPLNGPFGLANSFLIFVSFATIGLLWRRVAG